MNFRMIAAAAGLALSLTGVAQAQTQTDVVFQPQPRNQPAQVVTTSAGAFTVCSAAGWWPTKCGGMDVPEPGDKQLSGVVRHVIHTPAGVWIKTNPHRDKMGFAIALFEVERQIFLATTLNYGSMSTIWRYNVQKGDFDPIFTSGLMLSIKQPHDRMWDSPITRFELSYYGGGPRNGNSGGYVEYDSSSKGWTEHRQ